MSKRTNLFFGDLLPPSAQGDAETDGESVLVGTAAPVPVRVEPIEHHLAPEGTVCIGTFLGERIIGRCAVPAETAAEFLAMELFERPVALALNVRKGGPGLEANLLALVPLSEADGLRRAGPGPGPEDEPWKTSVPGAGYEAAAADAGDEEGENQLVGIFLGQVVRFGEDRRHPAHLVREAADMLGGVVRGRIGNVVDRLIEDLTGSGS